MEALAAAASAQERADDDYEPPIDPDDMSVDRGDLPSDDEAGPLDVDDDADAMPPGDGVFGDDEALVDGDGAADHGDGAADGAADGVEGISAGLVTPAGISASYSAPAANACTTSQFR